MQSDIVSCEEMARFGVEPGWSFAIRHRVRWSECDPFGHANHRAYFEWFEEARNRYLEAVGLAPLSPLTPGPVIAETGIRYYRPLAYADEILVNARTVRLGRTSFEMGIRRVARRAVRTRPRRADTDGKCDRPKGHAVTRAAQPHSQP